MYFPSWRCRSSALVSNAAVTQTGRAKSLLQFGAGLCIPAAIGIGIFAFGAVQANAFASAQACPTPTLDASSTCMSVLPGHVVDQRLGRVNPSVEVSVGSADVSTGYFCGLSPAGACAGMTFAPGTDVATGWWKGRIVLLGPLGAAPRVLTTNNPQTLLRLEGLAAIVLVAPAASLLLVGSFVWIRGLLSSPPAQE